jgi:hypothetical protein
MNSNTTIDKEALIDIIVSSQEGRPERAIREEICDGRLVSVADNLNRLLADAINNAIESSDIETLDADLEYAKHQLEAASYAISSKMDKLLNL